MSSVIRLSVFEPSAAPSEQLENLVVFSHSAVCITIPSISFSEPKRVAEAIMTTLRQKKDVQVVTISEEHPLNEEVRQEIVLRLAKERKLVEFSAYSLNSTSFALLATCPLVKLSLKKFTDYKHLAPLVFCKTLRRINLGDIQTVIEDEDREKQIRDFFDECKNISELIYKIWVEAPGGHGFVLEERTVVLQRGRASDPF